MPFNDQHRADQLCDDRRLQRILKNADEGTAEFDETARHLETCPRCRERLNDLSGVDPLVAEACEALRDRGDQRLDLDAPSPSVVVAVESLMGEDSPIDCETVSLDFLEPGRHPELLGRIGRYDVERLIGAGGMGVVLKGFDTELHRVVAIKVLLPHLANSAAARRRFAREAQAAAAVVHEHVIPIYNVETEGAVSFLVMQFVPGHSLQARVDEQGPLESRDVLRIARQAAAGLAAAHAQGVVHRDVKPANILLEESVDRVLISDFGLARTVDDASLTHTGILLGTPHYMSPEQASGQSVDPRSDLFSLGAVLYFMCTGRPPFRADSSMAVLNRICHEPHRPVDEINPDVPIELAEAIDRLLAKHPAQRFSSAQDLEAHCGKLLIALQQGKRLGRRRRFSMLFRKRPRATRLAIAAFATLVLVVFAAWGHWIPHPYANVTQNPSHGPSAKSPDPPSAPSPQPDVERPIPRDTFLQDVAETSQRIEAYERQHSPETLSGSQSNTWDAAVSDARRRLHALEGTGPTQDPPVLPNENQSK
jgi:serine/threonine protein kinase